MKKSFENIIKATAELNEKSRIYVINQLRNINNVIQGITAQNDSFKRQLTGIDSKQYNDTLFKALEILKIFGFNEYTFASFNPDFLEWFFNNTITNKKFNPKLMNFYLLNSLQQAFFIVCAENEGVEPTYNQVKNTMLTFDETIKQFEDELKLSLPDLITKLNGEN